MSEQLTRDAKLYNVFCLREAALDCHHTGNRAPMNVALDVGYGLGVTRCSLEATLSMTVREALEFDQLIGFPDLEITFNDRLIRHEGGDV